jgi:Fe-S cluster assembly scaffold protein SufB
VVKDGASAKISGKIKIEKCGAGAESFLTERVILFNPGAHAIANPELEIENNNVSSRHAASVSQIDEEKIFYLMARGLTREEAKKTIVEGFFESVLGKIENKEMKKLFIEKILSSM